MTNRSAPQPAIIKTPTGGTGTALAKSNETEAWENILRMVTSTTISAEMGFAMVSSDKSKAGGGLKLDRPTGSSRV